MVLKIKKGLGFKKEVINAYRENPEKVKQAFENGSLNGTESPRLRKYILTGCADFSLPD